jgi:GntR family transcriptional regulator
MFVANGARDRLRASERKRFVHEEWPAIQQRMQRLGLKPADLIEREDA